MIFFIVTFMICAFIYRLCLCRTIFNWGEKLFVSISACLLSEIFFAFFLALFGKYTLWSVCISACLCSIVALLISIKKRNIKLSETVLDLQPHKNEINFVFIIIIVCLFLLYFLFPVYYMWGRRDPALYFLVGTNIARHGSLTMPSNTLIDQMYDEIKDFSDLSFRGIYPEYLYRANWNGNYSSVQAQFLHAFSAALSIGYSIDGLEGLVRVPAIIGTMAVWAMYNFVSAFMGKKYGMIAALFMGLCPAQIWGARITQAEELCQWIFIFASFLVTVALRESSYKSNKVYMIFAGVLIGIANLVRIDSCLLGLGLLICVFIFNFFSYEGKNWNILAFSYMLTAFCSLLIDMKLSDIYIDGHSSYVYPVIILSLILMFINLGIRKSRRINMLSKTIISMKIYRRGFKTKEIIVFTAILADLIFKLLWFVRPLNQKGLDPSYDFWQRCFKELFEYIPLFFYPLFFAGVLYMMSEKKVLRSIGLFTIIGFITTCIYIYKPAIAPDHIWASRRWNVSVFPFIIVYAVAGIRFIIKYFEKKKAKAAKILVSCALIGSTVCFMLKQSIAFLFHPIFTELPNQYEKLVANMDDNEIYFVEMSHFGVYLRFLFDKNVVVLDLTKEDAFWDYVSSREDEVYYIGNVNSLNHTYDYTTVYEGEIEGTYVKQALYELPNELIKTGSVTNIYKLSVD